MNRSYDITILGNKFTILTDLTEDEVLRLEGLVKKKIEEINGKFKLISPVQMLLMALLSLGEELVKKERELKLLEIFVEEKINSLSSLVSED